jgi:hypothetical protein
MTYFLIAIIPSENIVLKIRKIRTRLFREFGLISARCLPEMLPVLFINQFIKQKQFNGISITRELSSSAVISNLEHDIFLKIEDTGFISGVKTEISDLHVPGIFTLTAGFYLGTAPTKKKSEKICLYLNSEIKEKLIWKKNNLELIKMCTKEDIWWNNITWETMWSQKISLE